MHTVGVNSMYDTFYRISTRFILLSISKGERNFPPHQLFSFAVGSSVTSFVIHNPFSQASFINIISSLIQHSPFDINECLAICKIINPLVTIILEGERNFPPHQLFSLAVGSSFLMFVVCNSDLIYYLTRHDYAG